MTRSARIRRRLDIVARMHGRLHSLEAECQRLRAALRIEADADLADALQRAASRADQMRRRLTRLRATGPARQSA